MPSGREEHAPAPHGLGLASHGLARTHLEGEGQVPTFSAYPEGQPQRAWVKPPGGGEEGRKEREKGGKGEGVNKVFRGEVLGMRGRGQLPGKFWTKQVPEPQGLGVP